MYSVCPYLNQGSNTPVCLWLCDVPWPLFKNKTKKKPQSNVLYPFLPK